ncbi:MAG: hypothetical protein F6K19_52010, partial [Cyanothece sp. SIO1E1]|nr:hypothetical protein [Cyanothece sp. SIO1E1]
IELIGGTTDGEISSMLGFEQDSLVLMVFCSEQVEPPDTLCSRSYTLHFEVEDTGPGIAPDELDTIFAAFAQTETGRQSQEGIGLGLPISRKFVQLMGGDLNVKSQLGQGTTFAFTISVEPGATIESDMLSLQPDMGLVQDQPHAGIITTAVTESAHLSPQRILSAIDLHLQLSQMPTEWVNQLHQAATQLDENKMLSLIEQMNEGDDAIATTLLELVNNFRFDKIVELTRSASIKAS